VSPKPSGIITTTTDFGHQGPFAAIMRGVILSRFRAATIVDLIHDIPAQWPPEAGFWVNAAYRYFPPGTVHLAVVDPGVGTERRILLVDCDGHMFLAPDNGLLARLLDAHPSAVAYHLKDSAIADFGLDDQSNTFHGRDIFAPIAAELAAGRVDLDAIGTRTEDWIPDWIDEPERRDNAVHGVIVTIDTFGNLISNIERKHCADFDAVKVRFAGRELALQQTYARVTPGDYLALFNSFDVIEIARSEGNASESLGAARGAPVSVFSG
jgi:S-adenosylmethionine hydrolase